MVYLIADVMNIDTSGITALEEIHKKLTSVNMQVNYRITWMMCSIADFMNIDT